MGVVNPELVLDNRVRTADASAMCAAITSILRDGFRRLGIEPVFEESFGVISLGVVDDHHVGTAYIELRDGDMRMCITFADDG